MNQNERNQLGLTLNALCNYYSRPANPQTIAMMVDDLSDFSLGEVMNSIKVYRRNPKNRVFPLPAQLIEIIRPQENTRNEAVEAAARIVEAVSKFGYSNPSEAKMFVGDLGWRVVERNGGWLYVCENLGVNLNVNSFQAQARDLAMATIERKNQGLDEQAPQLKSRIEVVKELNMAMNDLNKVIEAPRKALDTKEFLDKGNEILNHNKK